VHGGQAGAAEIGPPPPVALGSRDPICQREWVRSLMAEPWVVLLQARTRRRLRRLVVKLAAHAHWETWESWPTWERLMQASGWARSTMAGWLRQLRLLGWLVVLEHGSTPATRAMGVVDEHDGNRAAVYGLRVPLRPGELPPALPVPVGASGGQERGQGGERAGSARWVGVDLGELERLVDEQFRVLPGTAVAGVVDETWTPTCPENLFLKVKTGGSSRASAVFHSRSGLLAAGSTTEALRARFEEGAVFAFAHRAPVGAAQMYAAAGELRRCHPVLARLSVRWVRSLCRPYWSAGWTNHDVLHAATYRPASWSTLPAMAAERVVSPAGWFRSRLAAWRGPRGAVLPGYSAHRRDLDRIRARYGRQALRALPEWAPRLLPEHLRRCGRALSAGAAELLARRRRAERADALAAPRLPELAATPAARAAAVADWQRTRAERAAEQRRAAESSRRRLVDQARAALPSTPPAAAPRLAVPPNDDLTADQRHQLALQRARAERARSRRHW
jgi:hypothetical protein